MRESRREAASEGLPSSLIPHPSSLRRGEWNPMTENAANRSAGQQRVGSHRSLRVLFVDDEAPLREFMRCELPRLGHEVTVCQDGRAALKVLEKSTFDAAILDLRMPGISGIEVLEQLKRLSPDTEAVVMTGHASIETATAAMRLGAADYMTKPCKLADIEAVLLRIADRRELKHKNIALESRVQKAEGPSILVGNSQPMQDVHRFLSM